VGDSLLIETTRREAAEVIEQSHATTFAIRLRRNRGVAQGDKRTAANHRRRRARAGDAVERVIRIDRRIRRRTGGRTRTRLDQYRRSAIKRRVDMTIIRATAGA